MTRHREQSGPSMHTTVRWMHATAAARLAEVVTELDIGKRSLQLDTLTFYDLASASPKVWALCGPGPGGGSDAHYLHTQASPSATWVIPHALGKRASITVIDSAGDECEGTVRHDSVNQATVSFSAPFAGVAFCN